MNLRNFFVGRAVGLIIVLIIVAIIAGFYALNNHIYEEKQGGVANENSEVPESERPTTEPVREAENPEGEADPNRMTLDMKTWISQTDNKFTLTFGDDGQFSATTDCNSMGGNYVANTGTISFSEIFSTKMYCEGSKENEFAAMLQEADSYQFTGRGEFILNLKSGGKAVFR